MKITTPLLLLGLFSSSSSLAQTIPVPDGYSIKDTTSGDLDKDGIAELAVAYNTDKDIDGSVIRELIIYKNKNGKWTSWKRSLQALGGSTDGGMMGDPYGDMAISNNILSISHEGGSSWKWNHTDKYRFQDGGFYLIGYTSSYGKVCEEYLDVDFNLSTGKLIVTKEIEKCDEKGDSKSTIQKETMIKKGLKIAIETRHEKDIIIKTPKLKQEIYLASKRSDN